MDKNNKPKQDNLITNKEKERVYQVQRKTFFINLWGFSIAYFFVIALFIVEIFSENKFALFENGILKAMGIVGIYVLNIIIQSIFLNVRYKNYRLGPKKNTQTKIGRMPVNSRITIDYSGKKPSIRFFYPKKDVVNQVTTSSITPLTAMLFSGLTMLLIMGLLIGHDKFFSEYPDDCTVYKKYINISGVSNPTYSSLDIECVVSGKNKTFEINYVQGKFFGIIPPYYAGKQKVDWYFLVMGLTFFLFYFFYKWFLGLIFAKTKWGHKNFPELNKRIHNRYYSCTFRPRDINNNQLELPLFGNIYMDYEFSGEMSGLLKQVRIVEHPFSRIVKKGRKRIKTRNIHLWKAIFTFTKTPKTGKGEISWT